LLVLTFPLSNLLPLFDRIYLNAGSLEKIRNTLARTHRQ
jgi:hypothetical protein